MTRKNWLSALLAVMMVISMMACIALPAVAASDLTLDEAKTLPLASTATASDTVTKYQINSVDELLAASHASVTSNPTANSSTIFKDGDTIYITADLDITAWDPSNYATYEAGTGKYTTKGSFVASKGTIGSSSAYLVYDPNATGVVCDTKADVFAHLWNGFNARAAFYTYLYADFDGMGHTIKGFNAHIPFIVGDCYSTVKNLTFSDATVDATNPNKFAGWTSTASAIVVRSTSASGCAMENVHLINCHSKTPSANYVGGFINLASNGSRPFTLKNCSMVNTVVETTNADMNATIGLVIGAYQTNATWTMDNCFFYNNTIKMPGKTTGTPTGLLGYVNNGARVVKFDNIAVLNCGLELTTPGASGEGASLLNSYSIDPTSTVDNFYFAGNTVRTDSGTTAMNTAIRDNNGNTSKVAGVAGGTYTTGDVDGTPLAIDDTVNSNDVVATEILPGLNLKTAVVLMNENAPLSSQWLINASGVPAITDTPDVAYKVSFITNAYTVILVSDASGAVAADADTIALLNQRQWVVEGTTTEVAEPWAKAVSANTVYVPAAHKNHIEAIEGDNEHHNVVCDECTAADHNYKEACADVTLIGVPTSGGYFAPGYLKYTCACGNTWNVDDPNAALPESPISVSFDAETYRNSGALINVAMGAKGDSNVVAYTATVTYNPTYMVYTGYSTAFNCFVNAKDAATGKLVVAFANADGLALNAEAMTLNFEAANITDNTDLKVTVTVDKVAVDDGTAVVYKTPLTTVSEAEALVYYVDPSPKPDDLLIGDVNGDKSRDLLDAVLVIQKINSTIPAQQSASFIVWAADCDGDNQVTTNDVTVLLRNAVGKSVVWIGATESPIVVAPIL